MYAHRAAEDLKVNIEKVSGEIERVATQVRLLLIGRAIKFHIDDYKFIYEPYRNRLKDDPDSIFNLFKYMKMPYSVMWLDLAYCGRKEGVLAVCDEKQENISIFSLVQGPSNDGFIFSPAVISVKLKKNDINYFCLSNPFSKNIEQEFIEESSQLGIMFLLFLLLLNCKNITTEDNYPSAALNKSRRKKGRQELFTYKTLKLLLPGNREKHRLPNEPNGDHNRIHFCRGHFKEYTKEAPLLGRAVGLYWWQPHVRGQNRDGIVMKDYEVAPR